MWEPVCNTGLVPLCLHQGFRGWSHFLDAPELCTQTITNKPFYILHYRGPTRGVSPISKSAQSHPKSLNHTKHALQEYGGEPHKVFAFVDQTFVATSTQKFDCPHHASWLIKIAQLFAPAVV